MILRLFLSICILATALIAMSDRELATTIDLAGRQRMLTQKMAKEALLIERGIFPEKNRKRLEESASQFDRCLHGLLSGDKELGLVATDDEKIRKELKKVGDIWKKLKPHIDKIVTGAGKKADYKKISDYNIPLLEEMNRAVFMYASLSEKEENEKLELANDINLAGRQRMLTQRMAKDLLLISSGGEREKYLKDFHHSRILFDKTLKGLIDGDPKAGLVGTDLPDIRNQLILVRKLWSIKQRLLDKAVNENSDVAEAISSLDKLRRQMNRAVGLYALSIERQKRNIRLDSLVNDYTKRRKAVRRAVNLAGRQRMLTQRIAKLAIECRIGVDGDKKCEKMFDYAILYEKTLLGLLNGDSGMGLEKCENRDAREQISKIAKVWKPFALSVVKLEKSGGKDKGAYLDILSSNMKLLELSNRLVTIFEKGDKGLNYLEKERLHIVNIAGRERMLTQKMTKEKLLSLAKPSSRYTEDMIESMKLFEKSLIALVKGSRELGIVKTSDPGIKKKLIEVAKIWKGLKPLYRKKRLDKKELKRLLDENPRLLSKMDEAVKMIENTADY